MLTFFEINNPCFFSLSYIISPPCFFVRMPFYPFHNPCRLQYSRAVIVSVSILKLASDARCLEYQVWLVAAKNILQIYKRIINKSQQQDLTPCPFAELICYVFHHHIIFLPVFRFVKCFDTIRITCDWFNSIANQRLTKPTFRIC